MAEARRRRANSRPKASWGWGLRKALTTAALAPRAAIDAPDIDDQLAHSGNRKSDQDLSQIRLGISLKTPGSPFWYDDVNLSMVPEPASLVLLGLGACLIRRRRA